MDDLLANVYARTVQWVPLIAGQVAPPPGVEVFPAPQMQRGEWLADRLEDTARVWWGSGDPRVNATLWWYSASSILVGIPVATAMVTGIAAHPRLAGAECFLLENGYLGGIRAASTLSGTGESGTTALAPALHAALAPLIDRLAEVSGARRRALWAITTDSIANRSLDAGSACGEVARGSAFACDLVDAMRRGGAAMPAPRFVDVTADGSALRVVDPSAGVASGARRFTQRSSCCLIYEAPGADKCVSCPRLSPAERVRGLSRLV